MFERYDEPARRVLFFARFEASNLGSLTIESEHVLLGLIRESSGLAGPLLSALPLPEIRMAIQDRLGSSGRVPDSVEIPFSADAKRVLHFAAEEANRLEHRHIGSEHLLLGLLREEGSFAASLLAKHGLRLDTARERVRDLVAHPSSSAASKATVVARDEVIHIMDLVQRLSLSLSDNAEAAMRLALILEDLRGLKGRLEGKS